MSTLNTTCQPHRSAATCQPPAPAHRSITRTGDVCSLRSLGCDVRSLKVFVVARLLSFCPLAALLAVSRMRGGVQRGGIWCALLASSTADSIRNTQCADYSVESLWGGDIQHGVWVACRNTRLGSDRLFHRVLVARDVASFLIEDDSQVQFGCEVPDAA